MGVMRHGNPAKTIDDYISLSLNIKESHPKLLDWYLPGLYTLRGTIYCFISKVLMVRKHLDFMSQEYVLELFESLCWTKYLGASKKFIKMRQIFSFRQVMILSHLEVRNPREKIA